MEKKKKAAAALAAMGAVVFAAACSRAEGPAAAVSAAVSAPVPAPASAIPADKGAGGAASAKSAEEYAQEMAAYAALERGRGFDRQASDAEALRRELGGDEAGAVLTTTKELVYAYYLGRLDKAALRSRLEDGLVHTKARPDLQEVLKAVLAFLDGRFREAAEALDRRFPGALAKEPDSYASWLLLASRLGMGDASAREPYAAIQARYAGFPAYWLALSRSYRDAGPRLSVASADAAERCAALCPAGPAASEARALMARAAGLGSAAAAALRTRTEMEGAAKAALENNSSKPLEDLLPSLALADNPYTLFAVGLLRSLANDTALRPWFAAQARSASGRAAERLAYILGDPR